MQPEESSNWKAARGYIIILAILILLIFLTFYVSHLEMQRLHQDLRTKSGFIALLPVLLTAFKHIPNSLLQ